jgi:hypothetical protein
MCFVINLFFYICEELHMNQRERVIKTIEHKSTDFLPYQLDLTQGVFEKLQYYYGDKEFLNNNVGK